MWWVQTFRKNWILSFNTAKMAFNSRKSTFLCVFITTHHSFCLPNVLWKGGSPDPKDPPLDPPLLPTTPMLQAYILSLLSKITSRQLTHHTCASICIYSYLVRCTPLVLTTTYLTITIYYNSVIQTLLHNSRTFPAKLYRHQKAVQRNYLAYLLQLLEQHLIMHLLKEAQTTDPCVYSYGCD